MLNPPHPGELLREDVLPALKISARELSQHLGYLETEILGVLECKAGVSADLALRLELAGIGVASNWLAMQSAFDLAQARKRQHPTIKRIYP
ncbi:HigA family addiction module antitoxin [Pseudomonas sp. CAN2814]|uniref:HigA family addiction module antitoxin n=1 Tax=Pseudomonas sp. CAN1 TaxID=3046726 RepID=UPI0026490080|nr:HigA family addiction module antitoxin [Pseudomonas sp. CAN1]MDN6856650.1 HigA family addiction module antitoxin [Pseudomonas sp. CAN1]